MSINIKNGNDIGCIIILAQKMIQLFPLIVTLSLKSRRTSLNIAKETYRFDSQELYHSPVRANIEVKNSHEKGNTNVDVDDDDLIDVSD